MLLIVIYCSGNKDTHLLVTRLLELLVPDGNRFVNVGDSSFFVELTHLISHDFLLWIIVVIITIKNDKTKAYFAINQTIL